MEPKRPFVQAEVLRPCGGSKIEKENQGPHQEDLPNDPGVSSHFLLDGSRTTSHPVHEANLVTAAHTTDSLL
jgi:hypothetical protein